MTTNFSLTLISMLYAFFSGIFLLGIPGVHVFELVRTKDVISAKEFRICIIGILVEVVVWLVPTIILSYKIYQAYQVLG